jgi:Rod binding domain-containing protein
MDGTNLILTQPVTTPNPLSSVENFKQADEEKKKQIAKDFESILLTKLLNEMKSTIGDWSFEKDGATEQIHSIFWTYLGQELSNNGGMGLWKDIYKSFSDMAQKSQVSEENAQIEHLENNA